MACHAQTMAEGKKGVFMKINVSVIFGGRSVEHEVSIISAVQCINAIDKNKYDVTPIYISKNGIWYSGDALLEIKNYGNIDKLLSQCRKIIVVPNANENKILNYSSSIFRRKIFKTTNVFFPVMHGTHGEDGAMQGFFELMNIPYVGCNVLAAAICMDKIATKALAKEHNIPVIDYMYIPSQKWISDQDQFLNEVENKFSYPLMVKPANLGSSIGVNKVDNREEVINAIDEITKLSQRGALIEKYIKNLREINCSVLGDQEMTEASVCEEPISGSNLLSFQDKYLSGGQNSDASGMKGAKRKLPADIPDELRNEIQKLAQKIFVTFDCHGVVRMDFIYDQGDGKLYLNEINNIPGSLSFYLWNATGKTFSELTTQLIELAIKRSREKNNLIFTYDSNILKNFSGTKGIKNKLK